jgi:chitodextrinase
VRERARRRHWTLLVAVVSVFVVALPIVMQAEPADAQTLKPGFTITKSTQPLLSSLTNIVFLPGTSPPALLATGKCGEVNKGVMNSGNLDATSWSSVSWPSESGPAGVCDLLDRGLVGIDVDGNTVYLLYDYEDFDSECSGHPPAGVHAIFGRLTKLTANTSFSSLSNEQVLLDCMPSFSENVPGVADDSHTVGTVLVAPDHTLFVGVGDGSSYAQADLSALNAQRIDSPRGKIFHINANGSPAAGNRFGTNPNFWAQRVFAYGLRNPFRFSLQPGTNSMLYIGDVGWNDFEEIDVAGGGENFGWPCWEGPLTFRNDYAALSGSGCPQLYANPPANLRAPLYTWDHSTPAGGHGALGGVFATGSAYGGYSGAYFFADFAWNRMWAFQPSGGTTRLTGDCASGEPFGCDLELNGQQIMPVAARLGPGNDIFFADIFGNRVVELSGCTGNCPPVASGFVDPVASKVPGTQFLFDGRASTDSDGSIVSYHWDFGDGQSANGAVVTHSYPLDQNFTATLTATDDEGATDSVSMAVSTNHNLPTLTLTPDKPGAYVVGDHVTVTATARDENGQTIGGDSILWSPVIHHCPSGVATGQCHIHPLGMSTGSSFTTVFPDHGDDSYLEFKATATDANGFSVTKTFNLPVDEHTIALTSTPSGATISVNGGGGPTPVNAKAITNSVNQLIAPPTYNGMPFLRWSDNDTSPTKTFKMPASDVAFTAIYADPSISADPSTGPFSPVAPYRLFDTRTPDQRPGGAAALQSGSGEMAFDMTGQPGMPSDAIGALLNVTTTNPQAAGYVRVYPCGTVPTISTVNFDAGQTAANLAMVKLPPDRRLCFASLVPTDLVVDVAGWFSPAGQGMGSGYTTVDPVRVLDTRDPALAPAGVVAPLDSQQELRFRVAGWAGFPADATAALLNVTVTDPRAAGYVRVYPCGEEQDISNVNYVAGQTVANLAAVKVAAGGDVCFKSYAPADVVVDLAGWFAPGTGAGFVAPDPARLFDTRDPQMTPGGAAQRLADGRELAVQITGTGVVPTGATAVAVNLTAADPSADGYVKVYPCGGTPPIVSNVNYWTHQVAAANLAVVKLPPDGRVCFSSYAPTDLVVDLAGWFVG